VHVVVVTVPVVVHAMVAVVAVVEAVGACVREIVGGLTAAATVQE
jgi:hypothetical protein